MPPPGSLPPSRRTVIRRAGRGQDLGVAILAGKVERDSVRRVYRASVRTAWGIVMCALGCASGGQVPSAGPQRVTVSEAGGQVTLAVGQELAVELRANVTTGYQWELVPPVPEVVTVIDRGTYSAAPGSEGRVGAGGTTLFVLRAVRPGKGVLNLAYRRPWETDVAPVRTVRVDVEVR